MHLTQPISRGFTLLELLVVMTLIAVLATVTTPYMLRFYENAQFNRFVRELGSQINQTRYEAITQGEPRDFLLNTQTQAFGVVPAGQTSENLQSAPQGVTLDLIGASNLTTEDGTGVIRFYPTGSASGGTVEILRTSPFAKRQIRVDWLLGRVTHTQEVEEP